MSEIPGINFPLEKPQLSRPYRERANLLVKEMLKENLTIGEISWIFEVAISTLAHVRANHSPEDQTLVSNSLLQPDHV